MQHFIYVFPGTRPPRPLICLNQFFAVTSGIQPACQIQRVRQISGEKCAITELGRGRNGTQSCRSRSRASRRYGTPCGRPLRRWSNCLRDPRGTSLNLPLVVDRSHSRRDRCHTSPNTTPIRSHTYHTIPTHWGVSLPQHVLCCHKYNTTHSCLVVCN